MKIVLVVISKFGTILKTTIKGLNDIRIETHKIDLQKSNLQKS